MKKKLGEEMRFQPRIEDTVVQIVRFMAIRFKLYKNYFTVLKIIFKHLSL